MDEATSSLDSETTAQIHDTIQQTFTDCTLIIIAHSVRTVLQCDRVLVIDAGQVSNITSLSNAVHANVSFLQRGSIAYGAERCTTRVPKRFALFTLIILTYVNRFTYCLAYVYNYKFATRGYTDILIHLAQFM